MAQKSEDGQIYGAFGVRPQRPYLIVKYKLGRWTEAGTVVAPQYPGSL